MRKALVLLLAFYTALTASSQSNYMPGFVVDLSGDTIPGLIDYRNWDKNPEKITFRRSAETKPEDFVAERIRSFHVAEEEYQSAIVKVDDDSRLDEIISSPELQYRTDTIFLKALVKGDKGLYQYHDMNGEWHFFIRSDDHIDLLQHKKYMTTDSSGRQLVKENNRYKGQLAYYFRDCPDIVNWLRSVHYSQISLIEIFSRYHRCAGKESGLSVYKERSKIHAGFLVGVSFAKLQFKGVSEQLVETDYPTSAKPVFGIFLNYFLPRSLTKLSFNNELSYTSLNTKGKYEEDHATVYTKLGYGYLKINNMLRYNKPVGTGTVYFSFGMSNGFYVKETNYRKRVVYFPSDRIEQGKAIEHTKIHEPGILIGAGATMKRLLAEIRYEKSKGMSEYVNITSPVSRIYFLVGYRLW